ncbi:hypothetical protein GPECTOR_36g115 [Gonium pectorale]|uniref:Proteasome subunit alpha type n=1 Tax=Gonium pectorale TaxID=33097 RepID=A0A150GBQ0_GONPE|nr:hypothetical protein GPECTOR_36g115 [Gonium pectorale]|eukprot:KXZ47262.1 hypothetical protein GPECTOR_36g115 [Gonium pectorale]
MARRYDSRTTIFSPEGRLYQVEYAMEAISNAGASIGLLAKDGVVLIAEKKITSKLLDTHAVGVRREKMYRIDDHIACAVAGITSDANILVNICRLAAQRYLFAYQEPMPVEQLVRYVCDTKQGYTQFGGQRPFGVSILYAGWDEHYGFQLYQSDPSGNYGGWKAVAIGAGHQAANNLLKSDFKVLAKSMDTSLAPDKVELSTVTRDASGKVVYKIFESSELQPLLDAANAEKEAAAQS